jgi:hypothetical protein
MRLKQQIEQLRKIVAIRQLQCDAAETLAARAASLVSERDELLQRASRQRAEAEQHWQDVSSQGAIVLELMHAWKAQVQREDGQVRCAEDVVAAARVAHQRSVQDFLATRQKSDVAESVAGQTAREHRLHLEERDLQDASDRHLQKRGVS